MTLPNDLNNNGGMNATAFVSEEFFDDDDDALFGSSLLAGAPTAVTSNEPSHQSQQQRSSLFGMAELSYNDVSKLNHGGGEKSGPLPTPPTVLDSNINNNINAANDDDNDGDDYVLTDEDDLELLELDQRYLSTLRNPNSKYINVAKSCLALHQFIYSGAAGGSQNNSTALFDDADSAAISSIDTTNNNNTTSSSTQQPMIIQIEHSSPTYQINKYQNTIHAILTSLTKCLSFHNSPRCRILALNTLANIARSSYAKLHFDTQVACISSSSSTKLSSVSTTRVQDECGVGTAYTLVNAVLDQVNDNVSASALDALGKLTLDTCYCMDELNAEVRRIAECVNYCGSAYNNMNEEEHPSTTDHQSTIRNMSFKIYEHVIFPRMSSILHRLTLYPSNGHIAKALPIINAVFVHALTYGKDTMPSRRAIQSNKISHGKRGWREVNAEGLVTEYVMGILLPLLSSSSSDGVGVDDGRTLQRGIAVSCLRMSSVSPCATWRVTACRCAATVLLRQLNSEMGTTSSSSPPPHSRQILSKQPSLSNKKANNNSKDAHSSSSLSPISSTILSSALVPPETLAGTAAMLIIALRGIPLHERAPGLSAILRATLLYLPMGISVSSGVNSLDLPISTDGKSSYRLGRTGLLTEVVLSIMLDGTSNARGSGGVEGDSSTTEKNDTQRIAGTRSVLLQRILQSDQLTPVWEEGLSSSNKNDHPSPVHELLWVLCTVTIQVGDERARLFAQDAVSVVEWNNLGLVILDFFAGIVCNPTASKSSSLHPFTNASYAAYNGLFLDVLKRCGAFPPTTLSISENMLHGAGDSSTSSPTVVGGPGKSLHRDTALSLLGIGTKIIFLRDKSKINNGVVHNGTTSSLIEVQLVALLVDTWLGCCIMNHDAKQTNSKQLDTGLMFLPLCHGEIKMLLQHHSSSTQEESVGVAAQNGQVFIACLENVACMSELLASTGGGETNNAEDTQKNVGQLAVSMLNEIIASAKEGAPTDSEQGTWLRYQIALNATNAIARISKCIDNLPQSYPEDIASTFQVSPLIANAKPKALSAPLPCHHKSMENCVLFLYNHARLVTVHRTSIAAKAVASTTYMSGMLSSKKLIRPRDALRLKGSFSHSTIQVYEKVSGLPLLIPARSSNSDQAVTLTGSSDPVSLLLSHGMRRVRKGDSTEGLALVVTMRVFNVTPVPIRNGVRLELRISRSSGKDMVYDGSTSCVATSLYNHEIPPGDFVTWEVTLNGEVASTGLSLQPYVTFRGMEKEKESSTQKWVSGAGDKPTDATLDNDEIETTLDVVTLPCMSTLVPPIMSLLPCPLVFYGGIDQCKSNGGHGDAASFEFLWQYMGKEGQRTIPFVISTAQIEGNTVKTFAHTRRDYVTLDNNANKTRIGFAFTVPGGSRIFCTYQTNRGGGDYALLVRSDSSNLLETFVGTDALQALFLHFIFGKNASVEGTARLTR